MIPGKKLRAIGINREVVILSLTRSADAFCNSLLVVLIPLYVIRIPKHGIFTDLPELTLVGIIVSLSGFMFAVMQPAVASLCDRSGRRKPFILFGLGMLSVVTLGFIPANSYLLLLGLRMLQGIAIAFTIPTALALISDYADRGSVGGSMGVFTTARMTGFALGPVVGGFVMETVSFEAAFVVGAAGALFSLFLVWLFVPEVSTRNEIVRLRKRNGYQRIPVASIQPVSDTEAIPDVDLEPSEENLQATGPDRVKWVMRQLIMLGASIFVLALSVGLISALEPELNRRLNQTAIGFGIAFSMLTLARLIFQIPMGHLSDRIGRKGLIVVGMFAMAPLTVLQGFAPTTLLLSVDRFLLGAASAMIVGPVYALVSDRGIPGLLVRQMSILTMSFGLGIAAGPLLGGLLAGIMTFEVPFIAGGILNVAAGVMVLLFVRESLQKEARVAYK